MGALNSRTEGWGKRSHELADRTIEVSQSEHQRENRLGGGGKWAEPQGPMRLTKAITFISSEFWKMRKKTGIKTILIEIWLKTSV